MLAYLIAIVVTALVFLVVDLLWLSQVAIDLYRTRLETPLLDKPNLVAAGAFYVMYVTGMFIFAIQPAVRDNSLSTALLWGALFGFFTYATYDLTNMATLKGWSFQVVFMDVAWGVVVTSLACVAGAAAARLVSA